MINIYRHGEATDVHFHEQYPHMVTAWVYDHKYLSDDFNYEDLEKKYVNSEAKNTESPDSVKEKLDQ